MCTQWPLVVVAAWMMCLLLWQATAAEPGFNFRTNDVIAFVGGEDVVEMQRNGYLELLLTAALPQHKLRFRNLAFEGDTVFEQHRQLNFPSWEKQLERVGATVVIAQFGQAESLQGTNGLGRFVEAYGKLLVRFTNGGRRLMLLMPTWFEKPKGLLPNLHLQNVDLIQYGAAITQLARRGDHFVSDWVFAVTRSDRGSKYPFTRDGLHLGAEGHLRLAQAIASKFSNRYGPIRVASDPTTGRLGSTSLENLRQLILEKNHLWFDYWRPQNWAFLHGDRTEQASSRDHRDPKKRWFPEEMEKFLPLIEAKEKEIWKLAGELK